MSRAIPAALQPCHHWPRVHEVGRGQALGSGILRGLGGGTAEATGTQQSPWGWGGAGATLASNPAESFLPAGPGAPAQGGPPRESARALPWREGMCLWTTSWKPAPCSPWAYTLASRPVSSRSRRSHHCRQPGRRAGCGRACRGWDGSGQPHPTTQPSDPPPALS